MRTFKYTSFNNKEKHVAVCYDEIVTIKSEDQMRQLLRQLQRNLICQKCNKPIDEIRYQHDPAKATRIYMIYCHGESERYEVDSLFLMEHLPSEFKFDGVFRPKTQITSSKTSPTPQ